VVSSTAEAEIAGDCFTTNAQEACALRNKNALEEMGWPQGTTQITTDTECAECFAKQQNTNEEE